MPVNEVHLRVDFDAEKFQQAVQQAILTAIQNVLKDISEFIKLTPKDEA